MKTNRLTPNKTEMLVKVAQVLDGFAITLKVYAPSLRLCLNPALDIQVTAMAKRACCRSCSGHVIGSQKGRQTDNV